MTDTERFHFVDKRFRCVKGVGPEADLRALYFLVKLIRKWEGREGMAVENNAPVVAIENLSDDVCKGVGIGMEISVEYPYRSLPCRFGS